jgi:hypothetical protein
MRVLPVCGSNIPVARTVKQQRPYRRRCSQRTLASGTFLFQWAWKWLNSQPKRLGNAFNSESPFDPHFGEESARALADVLARSTLGRNQVDWISLGLDGCERLVVGACAFGLYNACHDVHHLSYVGLIAPIFSQMHHVHGMIP